MMGKQSLDVEAESEEREVHGLIFGKTSSASRPELTNKLSKIDIQRLLGQNSPRLTYVDNVGAQEKSQVYWKKFKIIQVDGNPVDFVTCNSCSKIYAWTSKLGNSNLKNHTCGANTSDAAAKSKKSVSVDLTQNKITLFSTKVVPESKINELNESLVIGFAQDLKPLRMVEARGFRYIAEKLVNFGATHGPQDISKILQHRTTLKNKHLPNIASRIERDLSKIFQATSPSSKLAFTFDLWSDKYQQRQFLSLTVHLINQEWKLKSYMLAVEEFEEQLKSTENIRTQVEKIISRYFGEEQGQRVMKNSFAVTDGGSNVVKVFESRLPCLCHRIHLIIQWTFNKRLLPDPKNITNQNEDSGNENQPKNLFNLQTYCPKIKDVLGSLKKLVEFFKKSGLNKNLPISLKQEVETRWNSQLTMLESYVRSCQEIKKILCEKKKLDKVSKIDDDVVKELIEYLKPFKECSEILSGDKYPTFHLIALWRHNIGEHVKTNSEDHEEIKLLKEQTRKCLNEYWKLEDIHCVACMLDPRYRRLTFVEQEQRERAVEQLKILIVKETPTMVQSTSTAINELEPPPPKVGRFSQLQDPIDNEVEKTEFEKYFALKLPKDDEDFDIMKFWKNASQFPALQKVARWLLAIPASQASDERVFSTTGKTLNPLRTPLGGSTLSQLTMISKNY